MTPLDVLITLPRGYGMGDAVQMSAVLRHVRKCRPHWRVDLQAEAGRYCVGRGIVDNVFELGKHPYPDKNYDAEVQILLYDKFYNFHDRPNTRVSSCLRDCFGLEWDAECGQYQVEVTPKDITTIGPLLQPPASGSGRRYMLDAPAGTCVAIHYQGDSSPAKKNLSHEQAAAICKMVEKLGRTPLLLDWRGVSPLSAEYNIRSVGKIQYAREWGGDAEMNCAVISQCEAFVGIDSGPAKCASATDTPALVIWTGHHPAPFHDPAPNTTHLVLHNYHGLEPVCEDAGVIKWFESHYNIWTYYNAADLVQEVESWLRETLPPA